MNKMVSPSIADTAFSCPHCGAFTSQSWYSLSADEVKGDQKTPFIPKPAFKAKLSEKEDQKLIEWIDRMVAGFVFFNADYTERPSLTVHNLYVSQCYNCHKIAVWVNERLVFPECKITTAPNPDLPDNIIRDYEEARSIVDLSPRAAVALLNRTRKQYRQGDILIEDVDQLPADAKPQTRLRRVVVAQGEATGHHHVLLPRRKHMDCWQNNYGDGRI